MPRRLALRFARGLLLIVLALGVYGMHTLGHLDGGHAGYPSDAHGMVVAEKTLPSLPAGILAFVPEHGMPGLDPTSVCLAILTSLVIVLLMAASIRAGRRLGEGGAVRPPARQVARPPPKPTSLTLASLSILRI
ncbi:hypothetical protein ACTMTI_36545 [Nonomuraea sp. H19]|uniref:hypothetical protein n=1 Tax=Nonomuraea sp. H19 TaxID=3452206 RepID=UPI003F88E193